MNSKTFTDPESGHTYTFGRWYVLEDSGTPYTDSKGDAISFDTEGSATEWCARQRIDPAAPYYEPDQPELLTHGRERYPPIDSEPDDGPYWFNIWLADELQACIAAD